VLAGAAGWLNEALHQQIDRAVAGGWIKHLGFVPEAALPALYAGAELFLYPSIYEGFGLPPVEAMASGVPTIVANRSCLPEICGDAVKYVDPDDHTGFATAILAALTDASWRKQARDDGLARAADYDWAKCAAGTAAVYARHID
jgi:alpha-1,3-rhamnosyl/mannosyltransferase